MGTNYYWHQQICDHCHRSDAVHVGKQSAGWSFGFRGWPHQLMNAEHPDWGFDPESPFGKPVMSRADWREIFAANPAGRLVSEYRTQIDDPLAWIDGLMVPDQQQIRNEEAMYGTYVFPADSRDAEGFRVTTTEFS